jgi:hypothetical protein
VRLTPFWLQEPRKRGDLPGRAMSWKPACWTALPPSSNGAMLAVMVIGEAQQCAVEPSFLPRRSSWRRWAPGARTSWCGERRDSTPGVRRGRRDRRRFESKTGKDVELAFPPGGPGTEHVGGGRGRASLCSVGLRRFRLSCRLGDGTGGIIRRRRDGVQPRQAKARQVPWVDRQVKPVAHCPDDDLLVKRHKDDVVAHRPPDFLDLHVAS